MQAILFHALAVHAVAAAGHLSAPRSWHVLAGGVPNPAPAAPPGLATDANTILGWGKWAVLICGVAGFKSRRASLHLTIQINRYNHDRPPRQSRFVRGAGLEGL